MVFLDVDSFKNVNDSLGHAVGDRLLMIVARRLELEITESVLISDTEELSEKMRALRRRGIRFAIDDFGTGYSSLRYLQRMPVDRLKLDQSFVAHVAEEGNDRIIATAVIALGKALGLRVIAEGIEREEQARAIVELGGREGQGYLCGVPLYAHTLEPILRSHPALVQTYPRGASP